VYASQRLALPSTLRLQQLIVLGPHLLLLLLVLQVPFLC
jgi:hypothetical protein